MLSQSVELAEYFLWSMIEHLHVQIEVLADLLEVATCESASSGSDGGHVAEVRLLIMWQDFGDKNDT